MVTQRSRAHPFRRISAIGLRRQKPFGGPEGERLCTHYPLATRGNASRMRRPARPRGNDAPESDGAGLEPSPLLEHIAASDGPIGRFTTRMEGPAYSMTTVSPSRMILTWSGDGRSRSLQSHPSPTTAIPAHEMPPDPRRAARTSRPPRIGRPCRAPPPCSRTEFEAASATPRSPVPHRPKVRSGQGPTRTPDAIRPLSLSPSPAGLSPPRAVSCSVTRHRQSRCPNSLPPVPGSALGHVHRGTPGRAPWTSCIRPAA